MEMEKAYEEQASDLEQIAEIERVLEGIQKPITDIDNARKDLLVCIDKTIRDWRRSTGTIALSLAGALASLAFTKGDTSSVSSYFVSGFFVLLMTGAFCILLDIRLAEKEKNLLLNYQSKEQQLLMQQKREVHEAADLSGNNHLIAERRGTIKLFKLHQQKLNLKHKNASIDISNDIAVMGLVLGIYLPSYDLFQSPKIYTYILIVLGVFLVIYFITGLRNAIESKNEHKKHIEQEITHTKDYIEKLEKSLERKKSQI